MIYIGSNTACNTLIVVVYLKKRMVDREIKFKVTLSFNHTSLTKDDASLTKDDLFLSVLHKFRQNIEIQVMMFSHKNTLLKNFISEKE